MIRFLINGYSILQLYSLRDCMVIAYKEATTDYPPEECRIVTKDISNALSWLEDEIEKREANK